MNVDSCLSRRSRIQAYLALMRLNKPIGIWLLLWPTLWALWIAGQGHPKPSVVMIFIAGVVLMRSAGCVINDFADRGFDGGVARTRHRPLASGVISVKPALGLAALLLLGAFGLVLFTNLLTIGLAVVGLLLAVIYPLMKRLTHLPQVFLGVAFAWAVPMAFAAQTGSVPLESWYLYGIALLWPVIYDTFYAMVDRADDQRIGIKSTAILWGARDRLVTQILQVMLIALLFILGKYYQFNGFYYVALLFGLALFVYQQWLIKDRLPANCFKAFLNNHWVGLVVFVGVYFGCNT